MKKFLFWLFTFWLSAPEPEQALAEVQDEQVDDCSWCGADIEPCNCESIYGDSDYEYDSMREARLENE